MTGQNRFPSIKDRLSEISAPGDPLVTLTATVDFMTFRPVLVKAHRRPARRRGGQRRLMQCGRSARDQNVTDAVTHDRRQHHKELLMRTNTSRDVWADSAYRSTENQSWLKARAEAGSPCQCRQSAVRLKVGRVFARQKARMRMVIPTIGLERAQAAITLANIAYNMTRWRWLDSRALSVQEKIGIKRPGQEPNMLGVSSG